jgi:raffinose/stachyose/melibiose transport system permease protein
VVLSSVIVGFLWKLFLHPLFGLVNQALALVDIQRPAWLGDERTALGSIILPNIWHWLGFPTLVLLAGMQRISREVIEAARLDGAG